GETEETLSAFRAALSVPCRRLVITTGGTLAQLATDAGAPVFRYAWDGPPRGAFGYGVFALLAILAGADVLRVDPAEVEAALTGLEADAASLAPSIPTGGNLAKLLALRMHGQIPVILGADALEIATRR